MPSMRLSQFSSDTDRHKRKKKKATVMDWLNGLAADFHDEEIVKLVRLDKCLKCNGDYV